jgi:hypothetical protein
MRAMRARRVNGYGDLKLVNLLLSARKTSDRFVQRPRQLADCGQSPSCDTELRVAAIPPVQTISSEVAQC